MSAVPGIPASRALGSRPAQGLAVDRAADSALSTSLRPTVARSIAALSLMFDRAADVVVAQCGQSWRLLSGRTTRALPASDAAGADCRAKLADPASSRKRADTRGLSRRRLHAEHHGRPEDLPMHRRDRSGPARNGRPLRRSHADAGQCARKLESRERKRRRPSRSCSTPLGAGHRTGSGSPFTSSSIR